MELIGEILGFIVILYVLYRYVLPLLKGMIADRQAVIQQHVEESDAASMELKAAAQRFESAVSEAKNEAARIRDDARADATRIREELKEQAEREVERIKQRGREQLVAQRDQMARHLRAELGGQALQLAEKIVVESLGDEKRRSATVDGFLDDLDRMTARQSVPAGGGAN
jgi:F-type H+-transporting ATPase subunit b